jgi:polysaccharide export outer membrane protein
VKTTSTYAFGLVALALTASLAAGQERAEAPAASAASAAVTTPAGYVIGPEDVLIVMFWREKDLSAEVVVRPDGRISLPLLNEMQAAGLTPEQLRATLAEAASRYIEAPAPSVLVKQINSRKAFITGEVARPGPYPLGNSMTVMQLIALAGGLNAYADSNNIVVIRSGASGNVLHKFNYTHVREGKNIGQNITLEPGDTVVVP